MLQGFSPLCVAVFRAEQPGDAATKVLESLIAAGGDTSSADEKGIDLDPRMAVVSDSHYQSTLDAVYVYVVPWSELPIVSSNPHYPQQQHCIIDRMYNRSHCIIDRCR